MMSIDDLQQTLGYTFVNQNLLATALTHRSYRLVLDGKKVQASNYERLEFLGDAVLELVITEYLYSNFDKNEGELTALRSQLVNRFVLAEIGTKLDLSNLVRISEHEKAEVGHARDSIVADAAEALLGALYIEGGYSVVQKIIINFFVPELTRLLEHETIKDPKTELQELAQHEFKTTPHYSTLSSRGKDHQKEFLCGLVLNGKSITEAWGKSKQEAQTQAAKQGLEMIKSGAIASLLLGQ